MTNRETLLLLGLSVLMVAISARKLAMLPRGYRNNNPGNIRFNPANDWIGHIGVDSGGFVIFDKMEHGIRAMGKLIDSYQRQGFLSIEQIINRWAPENENDTGRYIENVVNWTGYPAHFMPDREHYPKLVAAIMKKENGFNDYSKEFIADSLAIA